MNSIVKTWYKWLKYEPNDPRFLANGTIKIAAIGGGTGLSNMLRGLKKYSNHISAIVTVTDDGASSGQIRKEFDMLPPGDIRKCISALAYDEKLISKLLEFRFDKKHKDFGGHTLGNIWITALTDYFGAFEKAVEATSEIFQTAGQVVPTTLDDTQIVVEYDDGTKKVGEHYLDEILLPIKKISFSKKHVSGYVKAIKAIRDADLIIVGPGSLYGSLIPNLMIDDIKKAIIENEAAIKLFVANCSTERTQTRNYTIDDHLLAIKRQIGVQPFDYCLVNNKILRQSKDETKLGEINNISTNKANILGAEIILADVVDRKQPLFHDQERLAKAIIDLYNRVKK